MLNINEEIAVPEGVDVTVEGKVITVKGEKGELNLRFLHPKVKLSHENKKVIFKSDRATKREKRIIGTFKAHVNNMIKGVKDGYVYKLKICSSHFPMEVSIQDNNVLIKNFFGAKIPRKAKILSGVEGKVEGDVILLNGISKENVGQSAANIEKACTITNRDKRRFEDGIFITAKGDKVIQ